MTKRLVVIEGRLAGIANCCESSQKTINDTAFTVDEINSKPSDTSVGYRISVLTWLVAIGLFLWLAAGVVSLLTKAAFYAWAKFKPAVGAGE